MKNNKIYRKGYNLSPYSHKKTKFFNYGIVLCFFLTISSYTQGSVYAQQSNNTKSFKIEDIFNRIEKNTNYVFLFKSNEFDTSQLVNIKDINDDVNNILKQIFKDSNAEYKIIDNQILISVKDSKQQESRVTVSGLVTDTNNEPLIGVNIKVVGEPEGTVTNLDGQYSINTLKGKTIEFRYIGYSPRTEVITSSKVLNITLREDTKVLDEVVVTALGIKREEKALSYNVQKVSNEELTTVKTSNFVNSLAGKVAGVQISSSAAGPGAAAKVVMRGTKSITLSNNALYVIDGVPMNNYVSGNANQGAYSGQPGTESAADINPDDIESMSVLTGPSAAALYGYEGANGVILITTKKGKAGRASVSYSNSTTFSSPMKMPDFQNKYGNAIGSSQSWGAETDYRFTPKRFFNTGTNVSNTVSVSAGSELSQSYLSLSTNNATGILPNNDYDRYNFTYRNTTKFFNNKLELDASVNYIIQTSKNMVSQGQYFNPLPALYLFPRGEDFGEVQLYERYDASREVNTQYWPYGDQGLSLQNPYWIMERMNRKNSRRRYMISATLKYNITSWLNIVGRANIDNSNFRNTDKRHAGTLATFAGEKGRYKLGLRDERQTYADAMINLDKRIGDFTININLGASIKDRRMTDNTIEGDLEKVTNWFTTENMGRAVGVFKLDDDALKRQTQSVFANAEIGYNNFLYLTLTGRNDWDSALAWSESKERSFFYPSVGLSTLISEVVKLPTWFTYLKGRIAFTSVGNSYDPYLTREYYIYNDQTDQYALSRIRPNYFLKPEITNSYEFGVNLKFLQNTLSLDATYYISDTRNQTHQIIEAGDTYDGKLIQAGNVRNSGLELALGYNNKWNEFSWSSNVTFTYNKNKITKLLDNEYQGITSFDKATLGNTGSPVVRITKGGTMGDIYMTSDFKRDNNGYIALDNTTKLPSMESLKPEDYKKLGTLLSKYNVGFRNSFSYKGIRLNVLFSGRFGGLVVSNTQAVLDRYGVSKRSAELREAGGVNINGQNISAQDYLNVIGEGTGKADNYVYKADNIRLQELSIEYTIPRKKLNNIADITVGFVGNNLGMIYSRAPFDPEVVASASNTYYTGVDYFMQPSLRNLGFSLKLQF